MPDKHGNPTENEIQSSIRQILEWRGWYVMRIQQGLGCQKGISDLIAVKNGRTVFLEIKKPTGKQSKDQLEFEADVKAHGGEYVVLRSVDEAVIFAKGGANADTSIPVQRHRWP